MNYQLSVCPLCGGNVSFHQDDEECSEGCHIIVCSGCKASFDLSLSADPANQSEELTALRLLIAAKWNRRAPEDQCKIDALTAIETQVKSILSEKPTAAMLDAMRVGSFKDWPSDELCRVRYAALRAAIMSNNSK